MTVFIMSLEENNVNSASNTHVDYSASSCSSSLNICKLEHSFSQSDLHYFKSSCVPGLAATNDLSIDIKNSTKAKSLRADFLHVYGTKGFGKIANTRTIPEKSCTNINVVVVIPSIDLDGKELRRMCDCIEFYEERQLYHILLARDPSMRIIHLSSNPVNERVIGYYLHLCRDGNDDGGSQLDHICHLHQLLSRIIMIHVPSTQCISLSDKILKDVNLIRFLKDLIHTSFIKCDTHGYNNLSTGLSVFTGSDSIDILSHQLGIRSLEASGDQLHYGTKQGSREIFEACGIPCPKGTPDLITDSDLLSFGHSTESKTHWAQNHKYIRSSNFLSIGIARQIARGIHPKKWIIKLNQGFSGKGNASIDLQKYHRYDFTNLEHTKIIEMAREIEKEFESMTFEDPEMSWCGNETNVGFKTQILRLGVIAESFIDAEVPTSPSIQGVIEYSSDTDEDRVSLISTHEQLLSGQVYIGCINPARKIYRDRILEMGLKVGKYMAARGVVGHFSVDFLASEKQDGSWDVNALEVNLRQGGTSHPLAILTLLCGGCMSDDGLFRTNDGEVRTYIATDNHASPNLKGCSESQFVDCLESKMNPLALKIRWNKKERIGVVFYLFKFLEKHGRIGFTAIGRRTEESKRLFGEAIQFLDNVNMNQGDKCPTAQYLHCK